MRVLWFLPAAVVVSLLLFLLMAHLAGIGRTEPPVATEVSNINLHRLKLDSEIQLRQRELLPPPEPVIQQPDTPQPPALTQVQAVNVPAVKLDMPTPKLDMNIRINAAANLSAAQAVAAPAPAPAVGISMNLNAAPVSRMNQQYPRRALTRRIEGFVVAEFTVDRSGHVVADSFEIIESSPPGVFDQAVERALLRWRFNPLTESGQAVPFRTRQRLEFKLE